MKEIIWIIFSMLKFKYALVTTTILSFSPYYIVMTLIGGFLSVYIFTQLGSDLEKYLVRKFPKYFKKFSKKNRLLCRLRRNWGIFGISLITPIIGIPIGVALILTLTTDKWKVIKTLSTSILIWTLLLSFIGYFL